MIMSEKAVSVKAKSLLERGTLSYSYLNTVPGGNEEKKKWQILHCSDINTESPF